VGGSKTRIFIHVFFCEFLYNNGRNNLGNFMIDVDDLAFFVSDMAAICQRGVDTLLFRSDVFTQQHNRNKMTLLTKFKDILFETLASSGDYELSKKHIRLYVEDMCARSIIYCTLASPERTANSDYFQQIEKLYQKKTFEDTLLKWAVEHGRLTEKLSENSQPSVGQKLKQRK